MKKMIFAFESGDVISHWCAEAYFQQSRPNLMNGITINFVGGSLGIPDQLGKMVGMAVHEYGNSGKNIMYQELQRVIEHSIQCGINRNEILCLVDEIIVAGIMTS